MKQQPDKLFQTQLKDFRQTPPPELWDRIEEGMQRKKKAFHVRYVAASVAVVLVSAYFAIQFASTPEEINKPQVIAQKNEQPQKPAATPSTLPAVDDNADQSSKTADASTPDNVIKEAPKKINTEKIAPQTEKPQVVETLTSIEPVDIPVADSSSVNKAFEIKTQLAFKGTEENVIIVMTTEQTQAYLINKEDSQATPDVKKSSTFKKLLKKAADLSSNQDPFGELRQKKNELLALNFKADKQRGQKK